MELSLLNLFLVLLLAWGAGLLASRLGYPSVLGELLAGIVFGPPLLGWLTGDDALAVLAEVGIILMMVYIGMEIDPKALGRASRAGLLAAVGGFATPFVLCYLFVVWTGGTVWTAVIVGTAAGVTSLATKSRILVDLKLLDTRIAYVMMAGALIADTIALVLFAAVLGVAEAGVLDGVHIALVVVKAAVFFAVAVAVGRYGLPALGRLLASTGISGRMPDLMLALLIVLLYTEGAELAGMHGILGAFLAGLFLREGLVGRAATKRLVQVMREASLGMLAPIFFVTAGFSVSLAVFTESPWLLLSIVGLATVGKWAGTALFYLPTGYGWREGLTVGAGMNGRGAVEIIFAQIALGMGLIDQAMFSMLVFMAIFTTATVPVFLKWTTEWLRRRGELARSEDGRTGVVIVGAGPTARMLGQVLARSQPVALVDRNPAYCAAAEAEGLRVVCGNALDEEVLAEAGAGQARHIAAMTANAEVNALVAQMARAEFYVPEVHVASRDNAEGHTAVLEHVRATTLFAGAVALSDWDYRLEHAQAIRSGLPVPAEVTPAGLFDAVREQCGGIPLALRRGGHYEPFHTDSTLGPADRVIVLQRANAYPDALDRFDRMVTRCPVLDIAQALDRDTFIEAAAGLLAEPLGLGTATLATQMHRSVARGTTVLLPGLAVPHVVVEGRERYAMMMARCRAGIEFPGEPESVHTVFVLAGTADERRFHLQALAAIAQVVQRPGFEQEWLLASGPEALRRLVLQAERRRFPAPSSDYLEAGIAAPADEPDAMLP